MYTQASDTSTEAIKLATKSGTKEKILNVTNSVTAVLVLLASFFIYPNSTPKSSEVKFTADLAVP